MALRGYTERLEEREAAALHFIVTVIDDWDPREIICGWATIAVACAAFQTAIPDRPKTKRIILHQGARMLGRPPIASDDSTARNGN